MKRRMIRLLVIIFVIAALLAVGVLLYKHFITDQIMDKGGMEDPDGTGQAEDTPDDELIILDGPSMEYDPFTEAEGTYVCADDEACRMSIKDGRMTYYKGDECLYDGSYHTDYDDQGECVFFPDTESVDGLCGFGIGLGQTLCGIPVGADGIDETIVFNMKSD